MGFSGITTQYSRLSGRHHNLRYAFRSSQRTVKIIFWATGIPPGFYQSFNCRDRDQHANSDRRARAGVCHLRWPEQGGDYTYLQSARLHGGASSDQLLFIPPTLWQSPDAYEC